MARPTPVVPGRGRRRAATTVILAVLLGVLGGGLAACSSEDPYYSSGSDWLHLQEQHLLDLRDRAVRTHDRALFMSTIAHGDPGFVRRERTLYANLIQFPFARLHETITGRSWPAALVARRFAGADRPRILRVVQVDGYDQRPERSITGLVFARRGGALKVVADRTRSGGFFPGYDPQPWDVDALHVFRSGGALGVFDRVTLPDAQRLLQVVSGAVLDDQAALPFLWSGQVMFYAFGDPALLATFRRVPGGNLADLGALSFPVYADPAHKTVAGRRFIVLPGSLGIDRDSLAGLVRHELTHVALGARDDGAPTWFIEGIAEYLAARPLSRDQYRIASVAVRRAAGPVTAMPASSGFNGPDQDWHYALAWMACDYIAATDGESRLWELMDAFHAAGGGDRHQDAVLQATIGMDSHALAAKAAARIRTIFG